MDLIISVEEARRLQRLAQDQIADALGITQGHYSKVVTRRVPLSKKLAKRMEIWLRDSGHESIGDNASRRVVEIAMSIRRECMELVHLIGLTEADAADEISGDPVT